MIKKCLITNKLYQSKTKILGTQKKKKTKKQLKIKTHCLIKKTYKDAINYNRGRGMIFCLLFLFFRSFYKSSFYSPRTLKTYLCGFYNYYIIRTIIL